MKKKAFTLIELIAVLVILAILALIVTPLVMNIIRKARVTADKRSIDAYGHSIELAIANYLLDTGKYPTSISELNIEYSKNKVVCSTTQLNLDSSIYLSECYVDEKLIDYSYGVDKLPSYQSYKIGDTVRYNDIDYYVIKNSGVKNSKVTLLKDKPLSSFEIDLYGGAGTENSHVNKYTDHSNYSYSWCNFGICNYYGGMAYYSSETCGHVNGNYVYTGCNVKYADSEVKYVVDAWAKEKVPDGLVEARLITYDELVENLGFDPLLSSAGEPYKNDNVPDWVCSDTESLNYWYWTMTPYDENTMWGVNYRGIVHIYGNSLGVTNESGTVRPVIVLSKSVLN